MTYYSNVRINIEADGIGPFKKYLFRYLEDHHLESIYPFIDPEIRCSVYHEDKEHLYFGWDNYNEWNEENPSISQGVMTALEHIYHDGYAYSYMREGEDVLSGDVEACARPNADGKYVESPSIKIGFDDEDFING